jgi:hypothetical protein
MKSIALCLLAVLAGCATQNRAPPPVVNVATPTCISKVHCDAMWTQAQRAIETATGMQVRLVTDGRIATYPPRTYNQMGGEVMKYPLGGDAYEMRASFYCYGQTECGDVRAISTNLFNSMVGRRKY